MKKILILIFILFLPDLKVGTTVEKPFLPAGTTLVWVATAFAYPNSIKGTLSLGINQATGGMSLTSDDRYLIVGYAKNVKIVDLGTFALSADQPVDLTDSTDTNFNVGGLTCVTSGNYLYAAQDSGNLLRFSMSSVTAAPTILSIESNKTLLDVVADTTVSGVVKLFILNNADGIIYVYNPNTQATPTKINLKDALTGTAFTVRDVLFVPDIGDLYIATSVGRLLVIDGNGQLKDPIVIDSTNSDDIVALAANPDGSKVYAVNQKDSSVEVIDTATKAVGTPISFSADNSALVGISVVEIASGTFAYVSGQNGISVFNATTGERLDQDTTNEAGTIDPIATSYYGQMIVSSDDYIYMSSGGGEISVLTDKPFITTSSVAYVDSASATATTLKEGGTVSITFQSDVAGTYNVRANGSIDESGSLLTDTAGATSGSVSAATDTTISFAYNTNSSILNEGANKFFIFVTDSSGLLGRLAKSVTVDLPPGAITMQSTGFGSGRVYVTFGRLTVSDIDHYNIYADTDPVLVQTKTDVAATATQGTSGDSVTGTVSGLANGTTYYLAVEAVDATSQVGPRAYLYPDGTAVSAAPQETMSLAKLSGETGGCSLVPAGGNANFEICVFMFGMGVLLIGIARLEIFSNVVPTFRSGRYVKKPDLKVGTTLVGVARVVIAREHMRPKQSSCVIWIASLTLAMTTLFSSSATAAVPTTRWWSLEVKSGVWMPTNSTTKKFFDKCCNVNFGINGGLLYQGRYGAEIGVGIMDKGGSAVGATTGGASNDTFNLFLVPMETNGVWRIDYVLDQIVVPYVKAGVDYVFFRENFMGDTTKGLKTGMHANGGLQFLLKKFDADRALEDAGISDFYVVIDARYGWVNSFGKRGLDLSGFLYSAGLLFEF